MPDELPDLNHLSAWQYDLPEELIASRPAAQRDAARMMLVRRDTGSIEHCQIRDLPDVLRSQDRLVFNNTKVLPARLFGFRTATGGRWEGLFLQQVADGRWQLIGQTRGRLREGETITLLRPATLTESGRPTEATQRPADDDSMQVRLDQRLDDGSWLATVLNDGDTLGLLEHFGTLPLPPYIGRQIADELDTDRYQTVFAREAGAIAAPTAGLHFTPSLLRRCRERGVESTEVTLHVGIGTFRPVGTEVLDQHRMHAEWYRITSQAVDEIQDTKRRGGRVTAVGTTSVRTLEAAASDGVLTPREGETRLFIRPGYEFRVVDQLLTNFHLPGSTLIVLVAALAGYELTMEAYRRAVEERYRFYSYGDAMLIL